MQEAQAEVSSGEPPERRFLPGGQMAQASAAELLRLLSPVPDLETRTHALSASEPLPGRPAHEDARHSSGAHLSHFVSSHLTNACDHLLAWRLLFTEARAQPTYAHMTLMRSALESALTVLWLLEPDDSALRVARGVALMRADLRERRKAEESVPTLRAWSQRGSRPGDTAKPARERLAELDRTAAGVRPVKVPDAAHLFASFARPAVGDRGGDWLYRLTSAFAHGRSWGKMLGSRTEVMSQTSGGALTQVTADDRATLLVTGAAMDALRRAVERAEALRQPTGLATSGP